MAERKRSTKSQSAYEKIRQMIVGRKFLPEHRWSIRKLAAKLEMSVVPITEAIRRLEQEGILQVSPQRGIALRQMTVEQRRQWIVIREALEVQAARIVAMRNDPAIFDQLRQCARTLQDYIRSKEFDQAALQDMAFHQTLVSSAGNELLHQMFDQVVTVAMVVTEGSLSDWHDAELGGISSHIDLAESIASGDPEQADVAMRRHLRSAANRPR